MRSTSFACCGAWLALLVASAGAAEFSYQGRDADDWLDLLEAGDASQRRVAAYALGRIAAEHGPAFAQAAPRVAPALTRRVTPVEGQLEVRWYAIQALGHLGPAAAVAIETISENIRNPPLGDPTIQLVAAQALGRIGPDAKSAVPVLHKAIESENATLRIEAALALFRIDPSEAKAAIPVIRAALIDEDADTAITAAVAAGSFGAAARGAIPALIDLLGRDDADVRRAAVRTLADIGPAAAAPLGEAIAAPEIDGVTLRRVGGAIAALRLLHDRLWDRATTQPRAEELRQLVTGTTGPPLADLLTADAQSLRGAAASALAAAGWPGAPLLCRSLARPAVGNLDAVEKGLALLADRLSGGHRERTENGPFEQDRVAAAAGLVDALRDDRPAVQAVALKALVELGLAPLAAEAEPTLRRLARSDQPEVRRYAAQALRAMFE